MCSLLTHALIQAELDHMQHVLNAETAQRLASERKMDELQQQLEDAENLAAEVPEPVQALPPVPEEPPQPPAWEPPHFDLPPEMETKV